GRRRPVHLRLRPAVAPSRRVRRATCRCAAARHRTLAGIDFARPRVHVRYDAGQDMRLRWPILVALLGSLASPAQEDARTRAAREELERQLDELTRAPPPRLELLFESPAGLGFELIEAQFMLDGVKLVVPSVAELKTAGSHPVFIAQVPQGRHEV